MGSRSRTTDLNEQASVTGAFVDEDGLTWYRIDNHDLLQPFLVSLVTPDDQWCFVSSSGALTAGRGSAERALFPYENDDLLHRAGGRTGPLTVIRVDGETVAWQPFAPDAPISPGSRSAAKTTYGDRLRFSEHHPAWGMTFTYTWATAGRFGLVRSCRLSLDEGRAPIRVDVLDGLVNVLPAGVELATQQASSTLVDGYRRTERQGSTDLALFTLEALVSDRPDPAEALLANVVWAAGLEGATTLLSENQVRRFRSGFEVCDESVTTGIKGAFCQAATATLQPGHHLEWMQVADVALDHQAVTELVAFLDSAGETVSDSAGSAASVIVRSEIDSAHHQLGRMVMAADGGQVTADKRATVHHFANVLFNCMRGGLPLDEHRVDVADVARFVSSRHHRRRDRFDELTAELDPVVDIAALRQAVSSDDDIRRLTNEYLPFGFSRRHGDPSRPWNSFRIPPAGPDGRPALGYQGNWRDIFQNWDALLHSYPLYIESFISKFLSASTADGHNPYRITDTGVDWEVPEDGSWGNFGYWGDHQIVYLHRLLLAAERFHPKLLESLLDRPGYSYADVPYRLRGYDALVDDPKHTLDFDEDRQEAVERRVADIGGDGRLVPSADGSGVHLATLAEKLMVPALAKLSNLVSGGGIWMNTQRPEWNDANNALVGNGVSMVTLLQLREYVRFVDALLTRASGSTVDVGRHVARWLRSVSAALDDHLDLASVSPTAINDGPVAAARRMLLDTLGGAYEEYRESAYREGPGVSEPVAIDELRTLLAVAARHLDASAAQARRGDGLVHTYSLVRFDEGSASIEPLYEMLEGQVAALSSSDLEPNDVTAIVSALADSDLHRADQESFVLYPNRRPPGFLDKNRIPPQADHGPVASLAAHPSALIRRDANGTLRFAAHLTSARVLARELTALVEAGELPDSEFGEGAPERELLLDAYETVFNHRAFTGRSQSMYRYEGLGSIYWHMVSKLLFAVQEQVQAAVNDNAPAEVIHELVDGYRRIRAGLGYLKSAAKQGTFPTDPHSHTPAGLGAQQPGMTGQVKEGVLLRWAELGVHVDNGRLRFQPLLLDPAEFLTEPTPWIDHPGANSDQGAIILEAGSLGFTYCGVPVVYSLDADGGTRVTGADGSVAHFDAALDQPTSGAVFARAGTVARIDVAVDPDRLLFGDRSPARGQ